MSRPRDGRQHPGVRLEQTLDVAFAGEDAGVDAALAVLDDRSTGRGPTAR